MNHAMVARLICIGAVVAYLVLARSLNRRPPSFDRARRFLIISGVGLAIGSIACLAIGVPLTDALNIDERLGISMQFTDPREAATPGDSFREIPFERLNDRIMEIDNAYRETRDARWAFLLTGLLLFMLPFDRVWGTLKEMEREGDGEASGTVFPRTLPEKPQ